MPIVTTHVAVVEHMSGMDVYVDLTEDGLLAQVAAYCRSHWNTCDEPGITDVMEDDRKCVDHYFDGHENDSLTLNGASLALPDEPPAIPKSPDRHLLRTIAAAMLPGGKSRELFIGQPEPDDYDADGEVRDGDLYRISADDEELAHWRGIVMRHLDEVPAEEAPVPSSPGLGETFVVLELIEQSPRVSVHPTAREATDHAVACAMENLYAADDPEDRKESEEGFRSTLNVYDCIKEGGYEVHVLEPTNG